MANLIKPVGKTTTLTALITNAEGVVLADAVTWQSSVGTVTVDPANPEVATFVGTVIETVTFTATTSNGIVSAAVAVDYVDNTPAMISVTAA